MTVKRIGIAIFIGLLGLNLVVASRIYSEADPKSDKGNPYAQMELIATVMEIIRDEYVDGDMVNYEDMTYGALKGILNSLDPHSQFMEPDVYADMKQDTEGKFGGLGIVITMSKEGFLTIVAPMEDTPGARAGLLPGDRIIKIEGKITERMTLHEAVRELRGEPDTKVTITVLRQKAKDPADRIKDHTITRAFIELDSVKDAKILEDNIGYIRITQFNEPTSHEFEEALVELENQGMDALILDLRNNPGGLLEAARQVASKFVPTGKLIVSTEGREESSKKLFKSVRSKSRKRLDYPLVILVNNGSASGSEIVAGALQDLKRAVLIGETTFGKGSVQSILQLPDHSAVRLTTAKYYTPSHKVIHEHGITPDIVVPISREDEYKLLMQRVRANLPPAANIDEDHEADTDTDTEVDVDNDEVVPDEQLNRAIDVIKGVKLFAQQAKRASLRVEAVAAQ